jgi:hypothetical protein
MNQRDLTEKLRNKYVGELRRPRKTVEEALQEALDNTTPEHSGSPNYDQFETDGDEESEWI